jgi:FMN reductase
MATQLKFVGLGGSFRTNSSSSKALAVPLTYLKQRGHSTTMLLLSDLKLPGFETCDRLEDYPDSVQYMIREVRSANGLIFATPVYHGTLSGGMKNALDFFEYLSEDPKPYLTDKVIGLISTSGGIPGINAINTMDYISRALHAWVCPTTVAIANSWKQFDADGNVLDDNLHQRLLQMARELEFAVTKFRS